MGDFFFPGSVMFLKFIYRLFIDQEVKWLDAYRSFSTFPIDIGFLAFSFWAAIMYSSPSSRMTEADMKNTMAIFICFIIATAILTFIGKKTEKLILGGKYYSSLFTIVISYTSAAALIIFSLGISL